MASWRLLCHHDRAGAMWLRLVRLGCTAGRPAVMVRAWGPARSRRDRWPSWFPGRADQLHRPGEAVRDVARLLAKCRLVTVTGSGGSGKTRLASEVAGQVAGRFADGVWLAELAAVRAVLGRCGPSSRRAPGGPRSRQRAGRSAILGARGLRAATVAARPAPGGPGARSCSHLTPGRRYSWVLGVDGQADDFWQLRSRPGRPRLATMPGRQELAEK
jgi:hypothetical protein